MSPNRHPAGRLLVDFIVANQRSRPRVLQCFYTRYMWASPGHLCTPPYLQLNPAAGPGTKPPRVLAFSTEALFFRPLGGRKGLDLQGSGPPGGWTSRGLDLQRSGPPGVRTSKGPVLQGS
ncbi:unnamed protein product [Boreogadus saida]